MTWKNRIVGYDTKPASQFTANPLNFRRHPVPQREALRGLLGEVGWVGAVLENTTTGNLIDGHARIEEALSKDEDTPIPYLKVELTEAEEKLVLASFDPISAMATADKETLDLLLKEVSTGSEAVEKMLADLAKDNGLPTSEPKDAEPQIDKAEELKQKWGTETSQLWVIGNHRLLVGDSTRKADVGRFCGGKVALVSADPPFGMGLFEHGGKIGLSKAYGEVKGDKDKNTALAIFEAVSPIGKTQVWWGANHWAHKVISDSSCWLVWDKDHHGMTFADGEMAWTNLDSPVRMFRHAWSGADRDSEKGQERFHVNQKPAALFEWYFPFTTKEGDAILDPCCGVGGSIVAAENLNRKCYAIEISPAYVAVCLERMTTAFPHLKIEKVDQARAA